MLKQTDRNLREQLTKIEEFTVFCGTFNLGACETSKDDIRKFLLPKEEIKIYDIIIISFQRIFELNVKSYFKGFFKDISKTKIEFLKKAIEEALSSSSNSS